MTNCISRRKCICKYSRLTSLLPAWYIMAKVPWHGIKVAALLGVTRTIPKDMWNDRSLPCQSWLRQTGHANEGNRTGSCQKLRIRKLRPKKQTTSRIDLFSYYVAVIVPLTTLISGSVWPLWCHSALSWHQFVSCYIKFVLWEPSSFWQLVLQISRINVLVQPFWFQHLNEQLWL